MTLDVLKNITNVLRTAFVSNKNTLEIETCKLAGIKHDDSKLHGEDGYYQGQKVEIKNTCWYGNSTLSGRVKFHDINIERINEFTEEEYWLVVGCWNVFTNDVIEVVYGFKFDHKVAGRLRTKKEEGNDDPELSLSDYEHVFQNGDVKVFYCSKDITPRIYTKKLYNYLVECIANDKL